MSNMFSIKDWKRMWVYVGIILMVLVAIALSPGCLEKNPIDTLSEEKHKEIDPYKGEKGDYEKQSKALTKEVQEQSEEPDEQIDATEVVIDAKLTSTPTVTYTLTPEQTPIPKSTIDEYCTKSWHDAVQSCLNLNSDGTCTVKTKRHDAEEVFDGTWTDDEAVVVTNIEGTTTPFLKLDTGNLYPISHFEEGYKCPDDYNPLFYSTKATPMKSAVGVYSREIESGFQRNTVVEIELKTDRTFETRVIYSPDFIEKWDGIWSEEDDHVLMEITVAEGGGRSTVEYYRRLDNTKFVDVLRRELYVKE